MKKCLGLDLIREDCTYGGREGPLAACRAVLFSQLVDDPSSWPDRFPGEDDQKRERERLHKVIEAMVPWKASNNEHILNNARWEIARSVAWGLGEEPLGLVSELRYEQRGHNPKFLGLTSNRRDLFTTRLCPRSYALRLGRRARAAMVRGVRAFAVRPEVRVGELPVQPGSQREMRVNLGLIG